MVRVRKEVKCDDEIHKRYTGKHVSVAILDTGIYLHPDVDSRIILFHDFVNHEKYPYDDSGHGTHVAGCLAGNGKSSKGIYRGIAPECNLIIGKVLDKKGEVKVKLLSRVRLLATPRTAAHQAPLSMGFSRQEYWSGCHCLLQE